MSASTAKSHDSAWTSRVRLVLGRYDEPLLRQVVQKLLRPRNQWPVDELIERTVETLNNAPVLDRRMKELPTSSRKLLAIMGLTRQPRWRVGHLITISATIGHVEGLTPIIALMEAGFLFPDAPTSNVKIRHFEEWLGANGLTHAYVFSHPFAAARCRVDAWDLPTLEPQEAGLNGHRQSDGLEWLLRIAAVWQQIGTSPLRLTQQRTLFKRDLMKLQADPVLNTSFLDQPVAITDAAMFALELARGGELFTEVEAELRVQPYSAAWEQGIYTTLSSLWSALFTIEDWDPLQGALTEMEKPRCLPSVAAVIFLLLATQPEDHWYRAQPIADWIWEHHPAWSSAILDPADRGEAWVNSWLLGAAYQLQLIEVKAGEEGMLFRLSSFGRSILQGKPEPPSPPEFRQTLTVQPNNEIIAFRQGLTPKLITRLSRFAVWKTLSAACMLELTPEQVYFGLESGLSQSDIVQTLTQHGMRAIPPTVQDAINRWSNKRERITLYASATLIEFATASELDQALSRGLIRERVTDRIGLVPGDQPLDMKYFRQVGNRDYEARPQRCIVFDDDGVQFTVDATQSDLLLEAELARIAEPVGNASLSSRRYRLTVESMRRAESEGLTLTDFEQWFIDRTGHTITAAARLLYPQRFAPPPALAQHRLLIQFATEELTDGVWQWPASREHLIERVGPTHVVAREESLNTLRAVLQQVGIAIEPTERNS